MHYLIEDTHILIWDKEGKWVPIDLGAHWSMKLKNSYLSGFSSSLSLLFFPQRFIFLLFWGVLFWWYWGYWDMMNSIKWNILTASWHFWCHQHFNSCSQALSDCFQALFDSFHLYMVAWQGWWWFCFSLHTYFEYIWYMNSSLPELSNFMVDYHSDRSISSNIVWDE